ncbi:MAG: HNH endonuclease signature motif containing protein [Oscillospiraceae bacterium]|nr:HNH endonuclease signature motif containing protein [Oscillospiraceae bacterium]
MAPLVRTGGSRHTGLAALPHRNIHAYTEMDGDHILPWSNGGKTEYDNLQILCISCNRGNL